MIARISILLLVGMLAAGCAHKGPASIAGGECKIFDRPEYEVRGQKQYDQDWIDSTIEGGGGGCGWPPPKPRPPELDAAPPARAAPSPMKRKPGLIRRIKSRSEITFTRRRAPIPALSVPTEQHVAPPPPAAVLPPVAEEHRSVSPPPAPPRCDRIEALLHPADCAGR
jgi:hypothetical protein